LPPFALNILVPSISTTKQLMHMIQLRKMLLLGIFASFLLVLEACKEDEAQVFDAPTIAVTADNSQPYPGDVVNFSIAVEGLGGLNEVMLDGTVIKSYTAATAVTTDAFEFEYTVPANSTLGPDDLSFTVTDKQPTPKMGDFSSTITIQNPDFRGNPSVLFDFQSTIPNATIKTITRDVGNNPWENAYDLFFDVNDPSNAANKVLQADRKGAHEWYFQGGGAVFVEFTNFISEDDIQKVVSGERVLQMNLLFKENANMVEVSQTPNTAVGSGTMRDMGWKLNDALDAWDYDLQDSVKGIPVILEIGNKAAWAWNDGNPLGKKFFLMGSITSANEWQTVTFSRRKVRIITANGVETDRTPGDPILTSDTTTPAYLDDPAVGLDQINYFAIIINSRKTEFTNTGGFYKVGENNLFKIADTEKNSYFIDNIRTINAIDFDKNPNN
jgi:hypothetical protein